MRRLSLRLRIAAFAAALVALSAIALSVFTVVLPWREKLVAQERAARALAQTALPLGVELRAEGARFDPARVHQLVVNAGRGEIVYALLWDERGHLDASSSSVNLGLLRSISEPLAQLYLRDGPKALEVLALGRPVAGIRRLPIRLQAKDRPETIGRLDLGLSTVSLDAELRRSLLRDACVLAATLLLAVFGSLSIASRITRPLEDLSAAMERLRQGDFDARTSPEVHLNDEVGDLAIAFDAMALGLKERERLRGTLGRYVSGDVAERILAETDDFSLPGELRQVTVLFLDVRGFTTISERLPPAEVVALLNEYFGIVIDRVTAHGGVVNKFIGDAAMCIWGAPRQVEGAERASVLCALEIQQAAADLSADRARRGLVAVGFGVGINAGEVVAGNLGAARRLEYTVIGDAVNLAQRLESQARPGEILVSESIFEKVSSLVEAVPREPVKLKGKSQAVPLWEVKRRLDVTEAA